MEGKVSVSAPKTAMINLPEAYESLTNLLLGSSFDSFYDDDDDVSLDFEVQK
jgi:hypothetical protein